MTALNLNPIIPNSISTPEEEYSIPLDISDIINICRFYNSLGWKAQSQIEYILEMGVDETIKAGLISKETLPQIKSFLKAITRNPYFGDATTQAFDCIELIKNYEEKSGNIVKITLN